MKDTKRRLEPVSLYDHTGIEKRLGKMAEKGWMIEKITTLGWIYRRTEPKNGQFSVTYYPKASEFDPELTEGQKMYQEFTAKSGWQFICSSAQMQVFYTEQEDPTPIETDPVTQVENIHNAAKKGFLLSHFLCLAVGIMNGAQFVSRLVKDPISTLASSANLFTGVCFTLLLLIAVVELTGYFHWLCKAKKSAQHGEFVDTPNSAKMQLFILCFVLICFAGHLVNIMITGSVMMRWVSALMFGYIIALILIVNAVKQFLKRKKVSSGTNLTITLIVDFVLAFAMMGAIVYGTLQASQNGLFAPGAETYEHNGSTFVLYRDELPLAVEDMLDVQYDGYVRECNTTETVFLESVDVFQRPRYDDENGNDFPYLEYTITCVRIPSLYQLCKNDLLGKFDASGNIWFPQGYSYVAIDPTPWGAVEAYQLTHDYPMEKYLICYKDCLVEIGFEWEATDEHKAIVGEKLGGK